MTAHATPDRGQRSEHKPIACGVLCLCHSNIGAGQRGDPLTGLPAAQEWRPTAREDKR
jgi:hypothetical protein